MLIVKVGVPPPLHTVALRKLAALLSLVKEEVLAYGLAYVPVTYLPSPLAGTSLFSRTYT